MTDNATNSEHGPVLTWRNNDSAWHESNKCKCGRKWPHDMTPGVVSGIPLPRLTKEQASIISLYTGVMVGNFPDMAQYASQILGRPIWTHEFGNEEFTDMLKELCEPDFREICYDRDLDPKRQHCGHEVRTLSGKCVMCDDELKEQ